MMLLLFPIAICCGAIRKLFHNYSEKSSRWTGTILLLLALIFFILYYFGVKGIGIFELILSVWGKAVSML